MKYIWTRFLVALWASFMVATVGPALFGDMLVLTAPVTCAGGHINVQTDVYHPRPGETDITRTPLCTDANGVTSEIPTLAAMGVIWGGGFLPFLLMMFLIPSSALGFLSQSNRYKSKQQDIQWSASGYSGPSHETLNRLGELNKAFEQKLITRDEYDAKRKEVLKEM